MLSADSVYSQSYSEFHWSIPEHYNIAQDACDKWADGSGRLALIQQQSDGQIKRYTFDQLKTWSDSLAAAWQAQGIQAGDRIAILLAQGLETALAHLGHLQDRCHCHALIHPVWHRRPALSPE